MPLQMYEALGLRNLPVEQGIAGITILIRHLRARTHQGSLILISLAWWELVAGLSTPLLEDPTIPFSYDTPHLLSAHRAFLATIGGSLHVPDLQDTQPTPLRQADICMAFAGQPDDTVAVLPPDAVPAEHHHEQKKLVIPFSVATFATVRPQPTPAARWPNYLASFPHWELKLLHHATFVNKIGLLGALRGARHLFLASDGGAADSKGSFGAVVADADTILLECGGLPTALTLGHSVPKDMACWPSFA
jgi:hypothetical protein